MKHLNFQQNFPWFAIIVILTTACPVTENIIPTEPVSGIQIIRNQNELNPVSDSTVIPVIRGNFEIIEGRSVILGARLFPKNTMGGIHWQSSGRGMLMLSSLTGDEITITGGNGGKTTILVMARNLNNEVYAQAECAITVIPSSFFKWNYEEDGWLELLALSNTNMGKINPKVVRSGETAILPDEVNGGFILEGPGTLNIGSVMNIPTNSPFSTTGPLYDIGGTMDFSRGPSYSYLEWEIRLNTSGQPILEDERYVYDAVLKRIYYPLWNKRVRVSVDYETNNPALSALRIQVNNNTHERDNASAVTNWLVTELPPNAPHSGTLSGIFDANASSLASGVIDNSPAGISLLEDIILSNSFISLVLPQGRILIRSIKIESAD